MIRFYNTANRATVAKILSDKINQQLSKGSVLWLVAGGSSVDIAVDAAKRLKSSNNLSNLMVCLTDERFGPANHRNSNWKILKEAGFAIRGARLLPVLKNNSLAETIDSYTMTLEKSIIQASYKVALAGMGADGHILGIMPNSPAVNSSQLVVGYKWQDYTRLTPTVRLIKQLDEVIIYAVGAEKHHQLDRIEQEVLAKDQPAQLLKQAKQVSIYNDYKGEKL